MTDSIVKQHQPGSTILTLHCTDAAVGYIRRYLTKHPAHQGLRISIEQRGCSGYAYVIEPNTTIHDQDMTVSIATDMVAVVEARYVPMLNGVTLDLEKQGLNEKLVFQNPNASGTCGCGESFTINVD
ncbi:MAG: iron-sulfur cluster assembly accessory protein [Legionellales bacterium]|nr:iron-sulfur cluster assembly accessory protein [Legionellales bacterium]